MTETAVCFIEGTPVKAENGDIPIEQITEGMLVYAHDPETGETALKEVVRTFVNEASELVHITVNGEEIVCTNEHPFYSPVMGWIAACKLRVGDVLVMLNGKLVVVEQVQHELLETPVTVYNFEVEGFHTYYVGNSGVLVHNDCGKKYEYMSNKDKNVLKSEIHNNKDITFLTKSDAEQFVREQYPNYPMEVRGERSAVGYHYDSHDINGQIKNHINLYNKNEGFRVHIFWEEE